MSPFLQDVAEHKATHCRLVRMSATTSTKTDLFANPNTLLIILLKQDETSRLIDHARCALAGALH